MTSSPTSRDDVPDRELHRLFDGELSDDERHALRAQTRTSSSRLKLEGLDELRTLVRAAIEDEAGPIDAEATWANIAARIEGSAAEADAEGAPEATSDAAERPALRVIEGGRGAEREPSQRTRASESNPRESAPEALPPAALLPKATGTKAHEAELRAREHQVRRRRTVMVLVTGLAAAAAAAIVFFDRGGDAPEAAGPEAALVATAETNGATIAPPAVEPAHTEVVAVDFGANAGAVFSVEGEAGARYAVVWLADDSTDPKYRDAQL